MARTAATAVTMISTGTGQPPISPAATAAAHTDLVAKDQNSTTLRDQRSASTPAYPEKTTYGTKPNATVTDTHRLDDVRSSTSMPTASVIISWAIVPAPCPSSRIRKSR